MAYMSQERKREIVAKCKPILKKYGIRATFGVNNHSTLECNIKAGKIDFIQNYNEIREDWSSRTVCQPEKAVDHIGVNVYHYQNRFTGEALAFLRELITEMNAGNHDNSDIQTDYFDVGWYVDVRIGRWNKPYIKE